MLPVDSMNYICFMCFFSESVQPFLGVINGKNMKNIDEYTSNLEISETTPHNHRNLRLCRSKVWICCGIKGIDGTLGRVSGHFGRDSFGK